MPAAASFVRPIGCDEVSPEKGIRLLMGELAKEILPVNIEDELKQSYLDYAMSVIVGRRPTEQPAHR
jgi:hypothetical protein